MLAKTYTYIIQIFKNLNYKVLSRTSHSTHTMAQIFDYKQILTATHIDRNPQRERKSVEINTLQVSKPKH